MKLSLSILFITSIMAGSAFADSVTCKLQNERKSASVTLDLNDEDASGEGDYTGYVNDLNAHTLVECDGNKCSGSITIDSGKLEDEWTQIGFSFIRNKKSGEVLRESLTETPDKRPYSIVCKYKL